MPATCREYRQTSAGARGNHRPLTLTATLTLTPTLTLTLTPTPKPEPNQALMDHDHYCSAAEAKELRLVDHIVQGKGHFSDTSPPRL